MACGQLSICCKSATARLRVAVSEAEKYGIPNGPLGLKGPISCPETGKVLPLRGDLAHVALADRYLVAHYVEPHIYILGPDPTPLMIVPDSNAETIAELAAGSIFEALDFAGGWCWGCVGPDGPAGYIPIDALARKAA